MKRKKVFLVSGHNNYITANKALAEEIGVNEAIMFEYMSDLITEHGEDRANNVWLHVKVADIHLDLTTWSPATIKRILVHLIDVWGLLNMRHFGNKRERWFAINWQSVRRLESVTVGMITVGPDPLKMSRFNAVRSISKINDLRSDPLKMSRLSDAGPSRKSVSSRTKLRDTERGHAHSSSLRNSLKRIAKDSEKYILNPSPSAQKIKIYESGPRNGPQALKKSEDFFNQENTRRKAAPRSRKTDTKGNTQPGQGALFKLGKVKRSGTKVNPNTEYGVAFTTLARICYGVKNEKEASLLTGRQKGPIYGVITSLQKAGGDLSRLNDFEKWWANSWMSKNKETGQYQRPTPVQVQENWFTAMTDRDTTAAQDLKRVDEISEKILVDAIMTSARGSMDE